MPVVHEPLCERGASVCRRFRALRSGDEMPRDIDSDSGLVEERVSSQSAGRNC